MGTINIKAEFIHKWNNGDFGNKLRSWDNIRDLIFSDYRGLLSIRSRIAGSKYCEYNVPYQTIYNRYHQYLSNAIIGVEALYFNESAPDDKLLIQGEIIRSINHYDLHYSFLKDKMRTALKKDSKYASGLQALNILKHYLNPSSYSDLELLFDNYPDSAIEFSAYSINLGNIPHRNTLIWEVRNY